MLQSTPPKSNGLIHVYTGPGKGKTTCAIGLMTRAIGAGWKVAMVAFDKGGEHYSERAVYANQLKGDVDFFSSGLDRIDPVTNKFRFGVTDADRAEAVRGLQKVRELMESNAYDLLVMDEINTTIDLGMLDLNDVLSAIRSKPDRLELVCTGRNCSQELIDIADLVSEIQDRKHYMYRGVRAREGIDY